jgi:protein SCO1/2
MALITKGVSNLGARDLQVPGCPGPKGPGLRAFVSFVCFVAFVVNSVSVAHAQFTPPLSVPPPAASEQVPILKEVGLDKHHNELVPLDTPFVDELGRDVTLGAYFGKKPVVLVLAYYDCPMLCGLVLNGAVASLETLSLDAGKDFEFVVVSFNPGDTPASAKTKYDGYVARYGRPRGAAGFHFLTGRESSIKALTSAVGFKYAYDPAIGQYAHPSLMTVLTPEGRISRYLYGFDFPGYDLRLALVEAASGTIGTPLDKALLYCYHYDPATGKYGFAILNVVRLGGLLTVAAMVAYALVSLRRERRQTRLTAVASTATGVR